MGSQDLLIEFNKNRIKKGLSPISMEDYLIMIDKRNKTITTLMALGGGFILGGFLFSNFLKSRSYL